jgi:F-type H+-transporting ATPase subunit delta
MANVSVIAKPYAKAAFEFASEHKAIEQWSSELDAFASIVKSDTVARIIASPMLSQSEIVEVVKDHLDQNFANFLYLIADNKRLELLPSIALQFEKIKNAQLNNKLASVTLAYKAGAALLESLRLSLEKKFDCSIDLDVKIDPTIIGGAIVKVGDTVIDDSVSGRLEKMKSILLS